MTKIATSLIFLVFLGAASLAGGQNPSSTPNTPAGPSGKAAGPGMMAVHGPHDMAKMHEQMMKEMQGDLDTMRSNLQKMKDQLGKISDRETKEEMRLNLEMWQSVFNQMDKHLASMNKMMGDHQPGIQGMDHEHGQPAEPPKQ